MHIATLSTRTSPLLTSLHSLHFSSLQNEIKWNKYKIKWVGSLQWQSNFGLSVHFWQCVSKCRHWRVAWSAGTSGCHVELYCNESFLTSVSVVCRRSCELHMTVIKTSNEVEFFWVRHRTDDAICSVGLFCFFDRVCHVLKESPSSVLYFLLSEPRGFKGCYRKLTAASFNSGTKPRF